MKRICLLFVLIAVISIAVSAEEGKVPVYKDCTISSSGHYYLTGNINVSSSPAISINADNVTLDLNGFTITSEPNYFIIHIPEGRTGIVIRNGRIKGGFCAIHYTSATQNTRVVIQNLEFIKQSDYSVFLNGAEYAEIEGCFIDGGKGLSVGNSSSPSTVKLTGNIITNSSAVGFSVGGVINCEISGNEISGCAGSGISVSGNTGWKSTAVVKNNILTNSSFATGNGIALTSSITSCIVSGNTVKYFNNGIYLLCPGWVAGNECLNNAVDGIACFENTLLENNICKNNGGYGMRMWATTYNNYYRDNMLLNNTAGANYGGNDAGGNITN